MRLTHFLTSVERLRKELAWEPQFDLDAGLHDSYSKDHSQRPNAEVDFSRDDSLFQA